MPRSVLQVLTSPAYSDTDGDAELSADAGGEAEVEVQGDLSELRDDPTADNVLDVGAQVGFQKGLGLWLRFLKIHLSGW